MGLMQFTTNFYDISKQEFLRLDINYRNFFDLQKAKVYTNKNYIKLKDVLVQIPICKINKGNLNNLEKLIDLGNIEKRFNNLINIEEVIEIGSDKNIIKNGDIIIPKIQPQMGNVFLNLNHKRFIVSTELIEYKIKNSINPYFLYYLITHAKFLDSLRKLESGKTHRRVISKDLLKIKIPLITKKEQDKIVSQIEPIEQNIKQLKSQIIPTSKIINEVFAKYFGFDKNLYNEFGKGMSAGTQIAEYKKLRCFEIDFIGLSNNKDLRFCTRTHNPPTKKLMNILNNIKTIYIKDIIDNYEKGIQPIYSYEGNISVVKIDSLKNNYIDFGNSELITENYYHKLNKNKKLKYNDIIICATGKVSLGKINFYNYNNEAITTVDNYILRLKNTYNPLFFTYFFKCILGYFQIERDYTGATNQIHLYWEQISNFKIPNISLSEQQKIVDEIQDQLDTQEYLKQEIILQRNRIDQIIEDSIIK